MKKTIGSVLVLSSLFLIYCNTDISDNSLLPESDHPIQNPPDPFDLNNRLGSGINLGNALEAPAEGDWGMVIEEEFFQLIKDAGFDAVRIPIRWNAHAETSTPFTIEQAFFDRIDEVIGWALERDLLVMINIHHYDELMEQPHQHRDRFLALWEQIAGHYESYAEELLFEVLNEPHDNLEPELWNEFLKEAIDVIRNTNPNRTVMIGTAPWGGFGGLENLIIPDNDRNIIVTVHYYNPFQFTHQGAGWAGDQAEEWIGTTWTGTDGQMAAVNKDFNAAQEWAEEHNRPIHLGEFGAYSAAPAESRELWTKYVREAAEERDFSWAYWEFGAGFGIYDRDENKWRNGLLRALLPESPELY